MLKKDSILLSEGGIEYKVVGLISSGTGQGDIYRVSADDRDYALKLFHSGDEKILRRQIEILMNRGKACSEYVHPLDILSAEGRLGYIMEYIPDHYLSGSVLYNGIDRGDHREELPFNVKLSVLHSLSEAVAILYNANLAIMDLKFDNLKIDPDSWSVRILDTDTVMCSGDERTQIEGTVGFMPPLTMRREESPSKYNDSFALAVIIFMTLLGSHPLMGRLADTPRDCDIESYLFAVNPVYVAHPTDKSNRPGADNARTSDKLSKYPKIFTEGMERTFVDGLFDRSKRTAPGQWSEILEAVYEDSFCCIECGEEHFFSDTGRPLCDACGERLVRPLVICGDKSRPLFFGSAFAPSDIWSDRTDDRPFLRVTATQYSGKQGFTSDDGCIRIRFPDGRRIEFPQGKAAPLFMNGVYEYQNKEFYIKEG